MKGYSYEVFLRNAFEINNKGEDPAGLALADWHNTAYSKDSFNKVKAGLSYAIAIYNHRYTNNKKLKDPEDYQGMDSFLEKALNANVIDDIDEIIQDYKSFINELNNREDV